MNQSNSAWQRNMVEKLIEQLEVQRVLYDTSCKNYLDQVERYAALKVILDEIKIYNSKITINDIKKKIKSLRTQYMREIRRMENADSNYKPVLWCFDKLSFLKEHSKSNENQKGTRSAKKKFKHKTEYNMEKEISVKDESLDDSIFVAEYIEEPCEETLSENIEIIQQPLVSVSSSTHSEKPKQPNSRTASNYDWLGLLVTSQIAEIPPEDQSEVAWEIQCVMRKHIEKARKSDRF